MSMNYLLISSCLVSDCGQRKSIKSDKTVKHYMCRATFSCLATTSDILYAFVGVRPLQTRFQVAVGAVVL